MEPQAGRRSVLRSAAVGTVALPLLSACAGSSTPGTGAVPPPVSTSSGADPRTTPLASVADVAVGGAVFIDAKDVPGPAVPNGVVITQPKQGEFHAFSRDCTHMHCAVSDLRDGKIHCFCHQSLYSMTTGANVGGPAPRPLAKVPITVRAGKIFRA